MTVNLQEPTFLDVVEYVHSGFVILISWNRNGFLRDGKARAHRKRVKLSAKAAGVRYLTMQGNWESTDHGKIEETSILMSGNSEIPLERVIDMSFNWARTYKQDLVVVFDPKSGFEFFDASESLLYSLSSDATVAEVNDAITEIRSNGMIYNLNTIAPKPESYGEKLRRKFEGEALTLSEITLPCKAVFEY